MRSCACYKGIFDGKLQLTV